jgi:hypothetical protein
MINISDLDLSRLETDISDVDKQLRAFNIFEILHVQRRELQHSNLLAYLLDPSAGHGLGVIFLKAFLVLATGNANREQFKIPANQVAGWSFAQSSVIREWESKDILILNRSLHFVAVVENKIGDDERGDQLDRYRKRIEQQYPDCKKLFVYLTPTGELPSKPEWVGLGYASVVAVLDNVLRKNASRIGGGLRLMLQQYVHTVRRHVVKDTNDKLVTRARDLYRKHQKAIEFIIEQNPSHDDLIDCLHSVIARDNTLRCDDTSRRFFRFVRKDWDRIKGLNTKAGWSKGSLLTVELEIPPEMGHSLDLRIVIHITPTPALARAIYKALEGKQCTEHGEYMHARRRRIPVPTDLNADFHKDVAWHVKSYVSGNLPDITRIIRGLVRRLST